MEKNITYEDVFQCTNNGVLVTDNKGQITHINTKALTALKLDLQTCVGRHVNDILSFIAPPVQNCLDSHKPVLGYQVMSKSMEFIINVAPVKKKQVFMGTICTFLEHSTFEGSAKKSRSYRLLARQLETIFHSSSDGLWVCDGKGTVTSINRASELLNGIEKSEVIGYAVRDLLKHGVFDKSVTSKVLASKKQETVMQHIARTGKHLLATGTPALDSEGNIDLIVVNERDMTELNTLRRQYEQSQKVKEKYREELSDLTLMELERNTLIAESSTMRNLVQMSLKLSRINASNILILGESGTGKGLLAKLIHKHSPRAGKPFIEINCAALPEYLLEAELFGYEKGAFTGASEKGKVGLIELAQGGTLFLDEIGDMPLTLQAKLLKYLDDQEIRRVGGTESIQVTCSTIAATNKNIRDQVRKQAFREDLYYRLNNFVLVLPPLKEREDDIAGLVRFYLNQFNQKYTSNKTISPRSLHILGQYAFPGNVRELKSMIENAVVMSDSNQIDDYICMSVMGERTDFHSSLNIREDEKDLNLPRKIQALEIKTLRAAKNRYQTTRKMAQGLGISQPSVIRKMKKYEI